MFLFNLPRLSMAYQYPISRCHMHRTVHFIHRLVSIQKLPTNSCKRCIKRDEDVQQRLFANQRVYNSQISSSYSQPTTSTPSSLLRRNPHNYNKPYHQQDLPIRVFTKRSYSSSHHRQLGADEVFSQEVQEQMALRLSNVRVPRSLFKNVKKQAAVLVPLCTVDGEPAILLTLRSSNLSQHRGEVSFPGGIQDESDADIIQTALRETDEELGIKPQDVDVWCKMAGVPNKSRDTAVIPVVGFVGEIDVEKLQLSRSEVDCAFTIPLCKLLDPINQRYTRFFPKKSDKSKHLTAAYTLPVFLGGPHRVWGLTAIVLDAVLQAWLPQQYTSLMIRLKLFGQK